MTSPRVLLLGYYGKGNFGDDVLLTVTYKLLKREIPHGVFHTIIDDEKGYVTSLFQDITILKSGYHGHFDVIVHGGGGVFFDFKAHGAGTKLLENVFEILGAPTYLKLERFVRKMTRKRRTSTTHRVGLGIGVGPFSRGSISLWRDRLPILADFDALWVRDAQSLDNLKRFAPVMTSEIIRGSDLAFLTEHWLPALAPKHRSFRPRLGIILRDWPEETGGTPYPLLTSIFSKLAQTYEVTGFIFDQRQDPKLRSLLAAFTTHIWQPHTMRLEDFAHHLHGQDVLLTSRAHGAICGACLGVPSVIVNIEPKLEQVHKMLPNATQLVAANRTDDWEQAIKNALNTSSESIAADVAHNRQSSTEALAKIRPYFLTKNDVGDVFL